MGPDRGCSKRDHRSRIFGLPSAVYAKIGAYSLIAFVVCAVVVTLIILCFAEVGSRFSETGGPYLVCSRGFRKRCRVRGRMADVPGTAHGLCG